MTARKLGFQSIATQRLILRPLRQSDNADVLRILADREVTQFTVLSKQQRLMIEHMQRRILLGSERTHRYEERMQWAITLDGDDTLIGRCGFEELYRSIGYAELGYWLARERWGQGMMSEAVCAVVEYGFQTLNLQRIQAWVLANNQASMRVLQKCGFHYEPRLEPSHDLLPYSLSKADYDARNRPVQQH